MCKFTNRLFVFALLHVSLAKPGALHAGRLRNGDLLDLLYNDYNDYGYQDEEIHYDQRQKGEENLQLRLDGFLIGLPAREDSHWLDMLAEEYLNNALLLEKSKKATTEQTPSTLAYHSEFTHIPEMSDTQVINIPVPKKDLESRQRTSDDVPNPLSRTKSHVLQLLQMFKRSRE